MPVDSQKVSTRPGINSRRCTLILSVATLNLLMKFFLDFSFQDTGSGRLVKASSFQNMRLIDPIVMTAAHNMFLKIWSELKLIHRDLGTSAKRP